MRNVLTSCCGVNLAVEICSGAGGCGPQPFCHFPGLGRRGYFRRRPRFEFLDRGHEKSIHFLLGVNLAVEMPCVRRAVNQSHFPGLGRRGYFKRRSRFKFLTGGVRKVSTSCCGVNLAVDSCSGRGNCSGREVQGTAAIFPVWAVEGTLGGGQGSNFLTGGVRTVSTSCCGANLAVEICSGRGFLLWGEPGRGNGGDCRGPESTFAAEWQRVECVWCRLAGFHDFEGEGVMRRCTMRSTLPRTRK